MPKILMIDIDTLRPDHMGCYGYSRNTTPNLDSVAADGMVFENYFCSDAPCLPSRAALVLGQFGIKTGIVGHGGTAADKPLTGAGRSFTDSEERQNLFYLFRKANMYTASISSFPERHSAWWFNAGFNETYNVGGAGMESGEEVLPIVTDWIDRNKNKNDWFLHVHLWDPHTPYRAPESFGNPFKDSPLHYNWITEDVFAKHLQKPGPHSAQDLAGASNYFNPKYPRYPGSLENLDDVKNFIDNYDCGIRYADELLGQVIQQLKDNGLYDDTAIIITSDHGENMGELGLYGEHATADQITCKIPMIIKWPQGAKGRDKEFRYNLDLLPTMADLLGKPIYDKWDGKSYAPLFKGEQSKGWDSLVLSQQAHVCQRSVRFDDYLYMRTIKDGFHLFDDEMLFNIKDDPHEQYNIAKTNPDICTKGAKLILDWLENAMKVSGRDPMWTVYHEGGPFHAPDSFFVHYLKRLENSGRSEAAAKLREKYK